VDELTSRDGSLSLLAPDPRGTVLSVPVNSFASDELEMMFVRQR
jgi:hypothetical protein